MTSITDNTLFLDEASFALSGQFFKMSRKFTEKEMKTLLLTGKRLLLKDGQAKLLRNTDGFEFCSELNGAHVSWLVTSFKRAPQFIDASDCLEKLYALLLFVELAIGTNTFLFIQRIQFPNPLKLFLDGYPEITELSRDAFLEQFTSKTDRYAVLSMRPMGTSKYDVRKKRIEAFDVSMAISSLGLNRTVPGSMQLVVSNVASAPNGHVSLTPSQQRIRVAGDRVNMPELVGWVNDCCVEFNRFLSQPTATPTPSFIGQMAKSLASLEGAVANSILVDTIALRELIDENAIKLESGATAALPYTLLEIISSLEEPISLNLKNSTNQSTAATGTTPKIYTGNIPAQGNIPAFDVDVRVTKTNCRVTLVISSDVLHFETAETVPFHVLINEMKAFRVVFDNGKIMWSAEGISTEDNLQASVSTLMSMLHDEQQLSTVFTEKGTVDPSSTNFNNSSSFHLIEHALAEPNAAVICDDGGDEWADYLSIFQSPAPRPTYKVRWYHAKVVARISTKRGVDTEISVDGHNSQSASGLQEVIGQALKNLGRLRICRPNVELATRMIDWGGKHSIMGTTNILKLRRMGTLGATLADLDAHLEQAAQNPFTEYEVAIVVPNYSLIGLETALRTIGTSAASDTVPQLYWLLSSFMHSCLEVGAKPVVYVQP